MENAFRWARSRVDISARADGKGGIVISVDVGPGLEEAQAAKALVAGNRLAESTPGFGFGLPITRELAELYGGSLDLARSPCAGLRVAMRLPGV